MGVGPCVDAFVYALRHTHFKTRWVIVLPKLTLANHARPLRKPSRIANAALDSCWTFTGGLAADPQILREINLGTRSLGEILNKTGWNDGVSTASPARTPSTADLNGSRIFAKTFSPRWP